MKMVFQVLSPSDIDEIYEFADQRLREAIPDESERMFASWTAKWRRESLEHYLKLGWSFIVRDEDDGRSTSRETSRKGRIVGYFLGQPFMFYRGQTQTLWIEHIEGETLAVVDALVDVAVRVAREKHLQRAIFANADELKSPLARWSPELLNQEPIAIVKTTKG